MQCSREERKTADVMDARFEGRGKQRMRWMQDTRGRGRKGCDGCNVLGERMTADAMDATY